MIVSCGHHQMEVNLSGENSTGRVAWLLFFLPVGFLVLTVLVRIVPFLMRPTLLFVDHTLT